MSASEFLELHLSPDSALEPEHQRECEHYMDDYAAAEVKRVAGPLIEALETYGKHEVECECFGDTIEHAGECRNCDCGLAAALAAARAEMEA